MAVARTSELEAINTMLGVIGESPINDLSAVNQTTDVILAKDILTEVSREVQSQGWYFNCEKDVKITPTADNEILIPANAARIDVEAINASSQQPGGLRNLNLSGSKQLVDVLALAVGCPHL